MYRLVPTRSLVRPRALGQLTPAELATIVLNTKDKLDSRRTMYWVFGGLGVLALLGGALLIRSKKRKAAAQGPAPAAPAPAMMVAPVPAPVAQAPVAQAPVAPATPRLAPPQAGPV